MHAATHWLDAEMSARLFNTPTPTEASPIWRVEALPSLYFPEILPEANAFDLMFGQYWSWIIDVQSKLGSAGQDANKRQAVFDARLSEMRDLRPKLLESARLLTVSASKLMKIVAGV